MTTAVPQPRIDTRLRTLIVLLGSGLLAFQAGTQYLAHELGYHKLLGLPVVDLRGQFPGTAILILGAVAAIGVAAAGWKRLASLMAIVSGVAYVLAAVPIYLPTQFVTWMRSLAGDEAFLPLVQESLVAMTAGFVVSMVGLLILSHSAFRLRRSDAHGSAAWGSTQPLENKSGFVLGKTGATKLRYDGEGHLMTVAPTRSGKGVGPIVSTLLTYPGSVVVTDPKGENYLVTGPYRKHALHHEVVAFDPFGVAGGGGAINPFDIIDEADPVAIDEARRLAETIVVSRGQGSANAAFFDEEARAFLTGLILHVCAHYRGPERSLATVRDLLTRSEDEFETLLDEMASDPGVCFGLVARAANGILQKDVRERSGVISTAKSHTHFLDSPQVARVLSHSTVPLEALKKRRISLYLIIPMDLLDAYGALLRLVVTTSISAIVRSPVRAKDRVLFLLDEFANLGRMNSVLRAVTLLAGFGATIWMIVQNLPQLRGIYAEDWQVLLDVDVFQTFGSNDEMTSKYVSDLTGDATVFSTSQANSRSAGRKGRGRQRSFTMAEKQRKLLTPDEVRRLPMSEQLIFLRGRAPIRTERIRYFEDDMLRARAAPHPVYDPTAR